VYNIGEKGRWHMNKTIVQKTEHGSVVIANSKQEAEAVSEPGIFLRIYPGFEASFFMVELVCYIKCATPEQLEELYSMTVEQDPGEQPEY
jgi:hypothetical protein